MERDSQYTQQTYIAISTMFTTRDGPSTFLRDLLEKFGVEILTDIGANRLGWESNGWH